MPEIIDHILKRRSIRVYQERPVEQGILTLLLQAAMAAPSACNSQPWEFVVVTEPDVMARLRAGLFAGKYNAPAAIAVCGNPAIAHNSAAKHYWVQDCSAAIENMLIAAAGLSMGAVWIGVYPQPSAIKHVAQVLAIPDGVTPLGIVYVGYPAESKAPRTQYNEHRIHWQQYAPRKRRAKLKNAKYL